MYFIFPPNLTSASALPGETGNPEIASFHLNVACFFAVNIWLSYRQQSCLSHALCVPEHCPAERRRTRQISRVWLILTVLH